ncbi:A-kinase anchor protein 12 [Sardina pilchardus]|uniref:A-kinase anchor protein 12 n=1 Tax=Sardina pilchardus TaxID=27697 RepID=UPI002E150041
MAATEACAAPVQAESTETKPEEAKPANAEQPANADPAPAPAEETKETTANDDATQNSEQPPAEQPAEGKAKPASENILGSFLNKSGLGKLMGGGKKKKESGAGGEDGTVAGGDAEKDKSQADEGNKEQPTNQTADGAEAGAEDPAIEKAPENDEAAAGTGKDGKQKQAEKSSVRDFIRKPVARIFSHRSTEKKEGAGAGTGEGKKHGKVRSRSLDRLEDADASTVAVEQTEDVQEAAGESDKGAAQTTKHMKRWHSFKKLMAQKSHKKSTDDTKEGEGAEGGAEGAGDSSTLDSATKSEHSGQKRWKLKRSWTFQGLKRDTSVTGFHKAAKEGEKEGEEKGEEGAAASAENDQGAAAGSEEPKAAADGETDEKTEGDDDKGAAAAPQRTKSVDQHANEIWTSFKKRVTPKSKKSTDASAGAAVEEGAEAAAAAGSGEQEQADDQQAAKDSGKTAKTKRTHFNRAVSLKNFIMRKGGKSTSVDLGGEAKEEGEEGQDGAAEEADAKGSDEGTADAAAGAGAAADTPPATAEKKEEKKEEPAAAAAAAPAATAVTQSDDKAAAAQVADGPKATDGEGKKPDAAAPSAPKQQAAVAATTESPRVAETATAGAAVAEQPAAEAKTSNRENGCPDGTAHNHEAADGENAVEEAKQQEEEKSLNCKEAVIDADVSSGGKAKDGKILSPDGKCGGKGNAVAQSEKKAGNV